MSVRSLLALGSTAVLALGFSLPLATAARAESLSAVDIINTYNLVVFGDLDSKSEVEGKSFIQGDITGNNTSQYNIHNVPNNTVPALTVGGSINSSVTVDGRGLVVGGNIAAPVQVNENNSGNPDIVVGGNVKSTVSGQFNGDGGSIYVKGSIQSGATATANGGSIYVTGPVNGNANANGSGSLHSNSTEPASHLPDIASQASDMKKTLSSYSSYLNSLTQDSTVSVNGNTATFAATAGSNGVAVFDINNPSQVFGANQFQFTLGADVTSIIVNVSGAFNGIINANFLAGMDKILGSNTIWNFTDATTLDIKSLFGGTILAMLANVTVDQDIEGSVIAQAVTQNAEIHAHDDITGVAETPVPASLPLFVAAIGGLFGWQQLRRRKQAGGLLAA